jgi:4-hydroxybenzoate polyprenyltransferase
MRSAGCVVNDYADRNFDAHVERTRDRPIAAGLVRPGEALALAGALLLLTFVLVLQLNRLTVMLSFVAAALAVIYPFLKRFFVFPQVWLGVAFGFAVPMAYAAQTGQVPAVAWALLAANTLWAIAYDTEYAMVDRNDDVKLGIRTSAITLGEWDVAAVVASYCMMLAILAGIGFALRLPWLYYVGLAVAASMLVHHWRLIRGRTREGCFRAFRHSHWIGASVFGGILLPVVLR